MIVVPIDQAVRHRLRHDLDTTFFVEAGAGTGKTTEIVARIVELAAAGRIESPRALVAMTFTVAAAAELRARVREGLEEAARTPTRTWPERTNCERVARGIDEAAIDTIHAFAGSLLRTFPLEAGLPPNFEGLDEIEQDIEFDDRFREWFERASSDPAPAETIRKALRLGLTTDQIRAAAKGLHDNYDLLHARPNWTPRRLEISLTAAAHEAARHIVHCRSLLRDVPRESITKLVAGLRFAAEHLGGAQTDDEAVAALRMVEHVPSGDGNMGEWDDCYGKGAGETLRQAKQTLKKIRRESGLALQARRQAVFVELLELLASEILRWSTERKRRGVATFQDLLTWSRDLLRSNAEVRRLAQGRWSRIFVDEFQDTDPLQAELAFYLAADPDRGFDGHWRDFSLVPGKLFLVGDPKQSIYRFRRADISLYQQVQEVMSDRLPLSQNFRSVPHIVDWVNLHYHDVMKHQSGVQPPYQALAAEPADTGEGVWYFGDALEGAQSEVWGAEARAVAWSAHDIVADEWKVSDGKGAARSLRGAHYRDICVLIPSRTNLKRLERAFDDVGVPYRLESGELIVATQEIRDLVSCLRAIDDPSDQVALVATLRSAIYGCSDDELLEWVEAGGRFGYEWMAAYLPSGRVHDSLDDLRCLHIDRHETSVPALIERILRERLLVPAAFGHPRPREIWRRYRYLVDRARAFGETGRTSLRSFVDWIEGIEKDQVRGVSPAVAETDEDAVRVMTVHGAKGLEFPVVILTGWGSKRPATPGAVIADRKNDRLEVGLRSGDSWDWATAGYEEARDREKELASAEGLRVSYVASTRARDHLVISLFRKKDADPQGADFARNLPMFELANEMQLDNHQAPTAGVAPSWPTRTPEQSLEAEQAWRADRRISIDLLGAMPVETATSIAHGDHAGGAALSSPANVDEPDDEADLRRDDGARFRRGRGATALGRAVHAVLETIDLETLDGLTELAKVEAEVEGIGHRAREVAKLVETVRSSAPVRAALASGRFWREVPVGATLGATTLEGVVDLLYEEGGSLFVVDYKTDDVSRAAIDERMAAYRVQGGAYAYLVAEATKAPVGAVQFIFARTGEVRRLDDIAELVEEVRTRLRERKGGPLVMESAAGA